MDYHFIEGLRLVDFSSVRKGHRGVKSKGMGLPLYRSETNITYVSSILARFSDRNGRLLPDLRTSKIPGLLAGRN